MRHSIKYKLICVQLFAFFFPALLFICSFFFYFSQETQKEMEQNDSFMAATVSKSFEKSFHTINEISLYLMGNDTVRDYLSYANALRGSSNHRLQNKKESLVSVINLLPVRLDYVTTIVLFSREGEAVRYGHSRTLQITEGERQRAVEENGMFYWKQRGERLYFIRLLKNIYDPAEILGFLMIELDLEKIGSEFQPFDEELPMQFLLTDLENNVLVNCMETYSDDFVEEQRFYPPDGFHADSEPRVFRKNGKNYRILAAGSKSSRTVLIGIAEHAQALSWNGTLVFLVSGMLFYFLVACLAMVLSSDRLVLRPLKKLTSLMAHIENEDYVVNFTIKGKDEISVLAAQFNKMADKLNLLYNQVYADKLRLREAEFSELEAEVKPHFLFNTLNTIHWMFELKHYGEAEKMLWDLSELYKITLYREESGLIPLSMELNHMLCYLRLQKARLQESLVFSLDLSGIEPEKLSVPKLILQPLVENSISHGILPKKGGEIIVSIYTEGEILHYHIYDNGVGIPLEKIPKILYRGETNSSHGRCLKNLHDRVRLKFGDAYGISIHSPADGGTVVKVSLPVIPREEAEPID